MRFGDINDHELHPVTIFRVQAFRGSDPLSEGRSGERAKYHHHRLFGKKSGERKFPAVGIPESKVDRQFPDSQADIIKINISDSRRAAPFQSGWQRRLLR